MTTDSPQSLVPKLRFPEFTDAPQWKISTIGECSTSFSGGTPDTSNKTYYGGTTPFIRSAEIGNDKTEIFLTKEGVENSAAKTVKRGDLLVALYGANSGDTALSLIDGVINQAIMCLRSAESVPYLYYYLTVRKKWIITTYLQGGQGNLSGQIILSVPLSIPTISEQQKIADCLGSLDNLIVAESRKLEALREHKQGLMQQLFPLPGKTMPKLRFPEFTDAPQWKISTIGECSTSFSGGTPDTSNKTYYGGTTPFIRSAEIGNDKTEIFLTKEGVENSAAKTVKRGDLLVALYGANSGDTALSLIDGVINQAIMCLRSAESVPYLYYYLTVRKKWIITTYLQGGQGNLSGQIILSVPLSIPTISEQQKIADCLGSLDDLIAAMGHKIESLRQHKQGLMQQLFPSI